MSFDYQEISVTEIFCEVFPWHQHAEIAFHSGLKLYLKMDVALGNVQEFHRPHS